MMQDAYNDRKVGVAIAPQTQTNSDTAIVGEIIDTAQASQVLLGFLWGTLTDADATFAVTLDESAASDMSGSNAVAAADLIGTYAGASVTFADDKKATKLGYIGNKRYLRATITPSGNGAGAAPVAAFYELSGYRTQPLSTQKV